MPDGRRARGPHPKDGGSFASDQLPTLRRAVVDLSWLLSRSYPPKAALKLVGDRYSLRDRQRQALQRTAASDPSCERRRAHEIAREELAGRRIEVDGFNVLLTIEAALCGGVLLLARDGTMRDLAAMAAHYRRIEATISAIDRLRDFLGASRIREVVFYLDRPVSNSGRLRGLIEERVARERIAWRIELIGRLDQTLAHSDAVVATADSAILDRCDQWFNLARRVVEEGVPDAWIVDLRG